MSFHEVSFFIENLPLATLRDSSETNYITVLFLIFGHSQLLVLLLFYTLRNLFRTLKLSYDAIHFRPIHESNQGQIIDEKRNFMEAHETDINILDFSN